MKSEESSDVIPFLPQGRKEYNLKKIHNKVLIKTIIDTFPPDLYLLYLLGYRQVEKKEFKLPFQSYWKRDGARRAYLDLSTIRISGRPISLITTPSRKKKIQPQNISLTSLRLTDVGKKVWNQAKKDGLWEILDTIPKEFLVSIADFKAFFNQHVSFGKERSWTITGHLRPISRVVVGGQKVARSMRKVRDYFAVKRIRLRFKSRVRAGIKYYKENRYLEAYNLFRSLLMDDFFKEQIDICSRAMEYEDYIIKESKERVEELERQTRENIEISLHSSDSQAILETYQNFSHLIAQYPTPEDIKDLQDLIKKVHDDALIKLWEAPFQKVFERIRLLLRKQKRKEAIQEGKLFLIQFEGYPYISQLNIWKDNLFSLIQRPIIQYWTEQYEDIRSRSSISQKAYSRVISQWEDFLTNTEEDKDIAAVMQLRSYASGRILTFKDKWARQDAIDAYFDLISLAEECYDIKDYEGAIVYMRNAIQVKKKDENERMIFLKDTKIHVNNAKFIYFCGDKITEREIEKLLHEAKRCFSLHDDINAKHKLHEAQDLHAKFSNLYKDKESGKYRGLIAQIRSGINRPIPNYSEVD